MSIEMQSKPVYDAEKTAQKDSQPVREKHSSLWEMQRAMISMRFAFVRFFSVPVPFLKSLIPVIGGRTVPELVISIALIAVVALVTCSGGRAGGGDVDLMTAGVLLLGLKHNVLTILLGVSFERAVFWHNCLATLMIVAMIIHAIGEGYNTTGVVIAIFMGLMGVSYHLKRFSFELFYIFHVVSIIALAIVGWLHKATYWPLVTIAWLVDLAIRYFLKFNNINCQASLLPGDVIRLKFKKTFGYRAGQFSWIRVGAVNAVEFHPFSISSCPSEEYTTYHIRILGDWTAKLAEMIKAQGKEDGGRWTMDLEVGIEGPFGDPEIDIESDKYSVILLISGGIGVTPLQSVYNQLIHDATDGHRPLRKVIFTWSVKDRAMLPSVEGNRLKPPLGRLPISFQPELVDAPQIVSSAPHVHHTHERNSFTTVTDVDEENAGGHTVEGKKENHHHATRKDSQSSIISHSDPDLYSDDLFSEYIFHPEVYLTAVRSKEEFDAANIHPEKQKYMNFGRPDIPGLFERTAKLCKDEGIKRVAVMVCGPASLVNETVDLAHATQLSMSCDTVRFDVHKEIFDF